MGKTLRCLLGMHKRENCKCVLCGEEVHKYEEFVEWKDCEPTLDCFYGSELIYDKEEYVGKRCKECGLGKDIHRTGMVSGK